MTFIIGGVVVGLILGWYLGGWLIKQFPPKPPQGPIVFWSPEDGE